MWFVSVLNAHYVPDVEWMKTKEFSEHDTTVCTNTAAYSGHMKRRYRVYSICSLTSGQGKQDYRLLHLILFCSKASAGTQNRGGKTGSNTVLQVQLEHIYRETYINIAKSCLKLWECSDTWDRQSQTEIMHINDEV